VGSSGGKGWAAVSVGPRGLRPRRNGALQGGYKAREIMTVLEFTILQYASLPDHPGKWRLMRWLLRWNAFMANFKGRVRRSGLQFDVDCASNHSDFLITWFGGCELGELKCLEGWVPRGGVVIDVGGNIGYHALRFGQMVGPGGKVYTFEPFDATYRRMKYHVELNHMPWVQPMPLALRERSGDFIGVCGGTLGEASVTSPSRGGADGVHVQAETLDGFVDRHGIERVDLVKMDVEGSELAVCEGGAKTLGEKVPAVYFECNPEALKSQGVSEMALLDWFRRNGFLLYGFEHGRVRPLDAIREKGYVGHRNVLAVRGGIGKGLDAGEGNP
jgi:FkbM family methyltransferase